MDRVKKFYRHNKILTILAVVTFLNCIIFILTDSLPEIYPGLGDFYKFSYDLSLAYLGSLIFYIVQVYMVNEKKKQNMKKQIFLYLFSIHGELYTSKYSLETLNISLNGDYDSFKTAHNKIHFEFEPRNDKELYDLFTQNILHSLNSLDIHLNTIEEYMKNIHSINISAVGSNFEFLDESIQAWIDDYRKTKAYRIQYHNRIPQSEKIYYQCMLNAVEGLYEIYDEQIIRKELNLEDK